MNVLIYIVGASSMMELLLNVNNRLLSRNRLKSHRLKRKIPNRKRSTCEIQFIQGCAWHLPTAVPSRCDHKSPTFYRMPFIPSNKSYEILMRIDIIYFKSDSLCIQICASFHLNSDMNQIIVNSLWILQKKASLIFMAYGFRHFRSRTTLFQHIVLVIGDINWIYCSQSTCFTIKCSNKYSFNRIWKNDIKNVLSNVLKTHHWSGSMLHALSFEHKNILLKWKRPTKQGTKLKKQNMYFDNRCDLNTLA